MLTGVAPASDAPSLAYQPGIGGFCGPEVGVVEIGGPAYPGPTRAVGLPVFVCMAGSAGDAVKVSIRPPSGRPIVLPTQILPAGSSRSPTSSLQLKVLVQASPPPTRYRISSGDEMLMAGRLHGDGTGEYRVRASGGDIDDQTSFTLEPAPTPQILNLDADDFIHVDKGSRLSFAVRGKRPLARFDVGVYGPEDEQGRSLRRTAVAARANKRGEAVVTLDIAPSSDAGRFSAVLEPYVRSPGVNTGAEPAVADFTVE
jgi:hypothetical protein